MVLQIEEHGIGVSLLDVLKMTALPLCEKEGFFLIPKMTVFNKQ